MLIRFLNPFYMAYQAYLFQRRHPSAIALFVDQQIKSEPISYEIVSSTRFTRKEKFKSLERAIAHARIKGE